MNQKDLRLDPGPLLDMLQMIKPLSLELQRRLADCLRVETYPARHPLLHKGEISKRIYFIREGFARAFYHDREGREHTTWFMGTGDLMFSVYSFYTQRPADEAIELTIPSTLFSISWSELQTIYADFPAFDYHGRVLTEKYYVMSLERELILRQKSPEERYELLLARHPEVLQNATQIQVASYLGIARETLSRLRRKDLKSGPGKRAGVIKITNPVGF